MNEQKQYYTNDEMEIDLRQLLRVLKKWSKFIALGTLASVLGAAIVSWFILTPIYQSKALLMVTQASDRTQNVVRTSGSLEEVVGSVSQLPKWNMDTYLGQLKSEALMKKVIEKLGLQEYYTPGRLAASINASIVKNTNLIEVKVLNTNPQAAAAINNALSEQYLIFMTEKNQEQMSRSVEFLEDQRQITEEELEKATQKLKEFQSQQRGVAVLKAEFERKAQDAVEYTSQLKTVQVEIQQLASRVASLEKDLDMTPRMISTQKFNEATGTLNTIQEPNPVYTLIAGQLSELRASLAGKRAAADSLQILINSMGAELDSLNAELASKQLEEQKLLTEVKRLQDTAEALAQKQIETQIAKSIDLGDTSVLVVSEASIPTSPIKPNKRLNVAIAFVLGLMAFTLIAFVLEFLDNTIKTPEDIERELELPVLGVIPFINKDNKQQQY
ncbi:MAG: GumC family protein [Syntrophomonadaceae bacterium]